LIAEHVRHVVDRLPTDVKVDLLDDPEFSICEVDWPSLNGMRIHVGMPAFGRATRSVVLKRRLRQRSANFTRYIIAHELAHAFLRNEGRHADEDPEFAADALAAEWGFPQPADS